MTPATQQHMHDPENGIYGDCQRAVIASLLDLPIETVPHFLQEAKGDASDFWERIQTFCAGYGYAYVSFRGPMRPLLFGSDADVYHEISGPSPRRAGVFHAVVGRNGTPYHDPHPSRAMLAGDPSEWEHSYLVRLSLRGAGYVY